MLYPGTSQTKAINRSHSLVSNATWFWMAGLSKGRGGLFVNPLGTGHGYLTGGPTWVDTDYGPGVQTDIQKYIKLSTESVVRPASTCSILVAYLYRYDASTSGSDSETGVLFSCGQNGISLRHGSTLEFLKSRIASVASSGSGLATRSQLCTAALTIGYTPISSQSCKLYFGGRLVSSGAVGTALTGTTATALGMDFGATTHEYGRHTILAAAVYDSRYGLSVLTPSMIADWDVAARQRFAPLFVRRPAVQWAPGVAALPILTAIVTKGFSFGSSFAPEVNIEATATAGLGFGVTYETLPEVRAGIALGNDAGFLPSDQFGRAENGIGLGSRPISNTEELANGRYRR